MTLWLTIWRELRHHRPALAGLVVIGLFAIAAIGAPWLSGHDPFAVSADDMLQGPSAAHWLGTDQLGRDIWARLLYGARLSFKVGAVAAGLALVVGTAMGVSAAYFGRWADALLSRATDVLFSFPDILLALAIMAILGPSLVNVMIAIGIVYTPIFARLSRGSAMTIMDMPYVEAARSMGVGHLAIITRHILPNIMAPLVVQTTLSFAFAILAEAALSFLGLGVEPDTPSWGIMLNDGKDWMASAWWVAVFPGLAITLAVLCFNLLGDGLRDALDPRLKEARP